MLTTTQAAYHLKCNPTPGYKPELTVIGVSEPMTRGEAIRAFDAQIARMRAAGFKIRRSTMAGTIRRAEIWSKVSQRTEAIYWIDGNLSDELGKALGSC